MLKIEESCKVGYKKLRNIFQGWNLSSVQKFSYIKSKTKTKIIFVIILNIYWCSWLY